MYKFLEKYWLLIAILAIVSYQFSINGVMKRYEELGSVISIIFGVLFMIYYFKYKKGFK